MEILTLLASSLGLAVTAIGIVALGIIAFLGCAIILCGIATAIGEFVWSMWRNLVD